MERVFFNVYDRTFRKYIRSYRFGLESAVGADMPPNLSTVLAAVKKKRLPDIAADYPFAVYALAMPYTWRSPEPSDVIRKALIIGEVKFTIEDCVTPSTEPGLNAILPKQLSWAVRQVNSSQRQMAQTSYAHAWTVPLDKWRAESVRGGDFVFIFETEDPRDPTKTLVFAACLQAKNANPKRVRNGKLGVDIRRFKSGPRDKTNDGYAQFRALLQTQRLGIQSGYIFYNNDEEDRIRYPVLPLVKPIGLFEKDLERTNKTDLARDTLTLAGYFTYLFRHVAAIGIPGDDDEKLAALIANATVNRPAQVVCLSHTASFEYRLNRILADHAAQYKPVMTSDPEWEQVDLPEDEPDIPDFKRLFR